jgi:hypothetical protein
MQCLLLKSGEEQTAKVLFKPEEFSESDIKLPDKLRFNRYEPIFNTIYHDLSIHCSENYCPKVSHMSRDEESSYFNRFLNVPVKQEEDKGLILNSSESECQIGLVPKGDYCPLGNSGEAPETENELVEQLRFARGVIINRSGELRENA